MTPHTTAQQPSAAPGAQVPSRPRRTATSAAARRATHLPDRRSQRGVASIEYLGMLPFLLLIALAGIQLGLAAYCAEQAGTAARTAARTASEPDPHDDPAQAGRDAVSGWVDPDISLGSGDDTASVKATARVPVPSVLPGISIFGPIERSATMPKEDTTP